MNRKLYSLHSAAPHVGHVGFTFGPEGRERVGGGGILLLKRTAVSDPRCPRFARARPRIVGKANIVERRQTEMSAQPASEVFVASSMPKGRKQLIVRRLRVVGAPKKR